MFFRRRGHLVPLFLPAFAVSLAVVISGCAAGTGGGGGSGSNVITAAQIEEISDTAVDVYSVVTRLRSLWLRPRGTGSIGGGGGQPLALIVYMDGARFGYVDLPGRSGNNVLRSIESTDIREIRYLDASSATIRYGLGHDQGALLLTSNR